MGKIKKIIICIYILNASFYVGKYIENDIRHLYINWDFIVDSIMFLPTYMSGGK